MSPSVIHRAACVALASLVALSGSVAGASEDVFPSARRFIARSEGAEPFRSSTVIGSGPQIAPVEFDFEMFEARPFHHQNGPLTRAQWVRRALRHNRGLTRAEARFVWRHPRLRRTMPIATHNLEWGVKWASPAFADPAQGSGGCQVSSTKWTYGYFVSPSFPFFIRDPLHRFTLNRTWEFDGWRVFPQSAWHSTYITPFADLRWNFEGITDQQSVYIQVGGSSKATHLHTRTGRFESIQVLGGVIHDIERRILAKWHGGWETPRHSAHFCTDND